MRVGAVVMQAAAHCLDVLLANADRNGTSTKIRVEGIAGGTAETTIAVQNDGEAAAAVRCQLTDVRRPDGIGPAFEPRVAFAPETLAIPPGRVSRVHVAIVLDERFDAGALYAGALDIASSDGPEQRLPIEIQVGVPHADSSVRGLP